MLNPRPVEAVPNLSRSTLVKGEAVFLFKIPLRFCVGDRPAGAVKEFNFGIVVLLLVLSLDAREQAGRIRRRGDVRVGLRTEGKSLGEVSAFVRQILVVFWRLSMLDPLRNLIFLRGRNVGSMFSYSESSKKAVLRLAGAERVKITV